MKIHLEQIKNTVAFMINYCCTYFIDAIRFLNSTARKRL
jgi:hypothetical protein